MGGRFVSGIFMYVDGHFYYGNNVMKITEDGQLNIYKNVLDLNESERVSSKSPMLCQKSHRMIYETTNLVEREPSRIIILPYIHERRVYLDNLLLDHDQFYLEIKEEEQ